VTDAPPAATLSHRLPLLDGLRGLAALGVVLFHANLDGSAPWFARGYLFVDLFFLLSGFVLTLAFEPKFAAGTLGTRDFARVRIRRFLPMIVLGAVLGAVGYQLHAHDLAATAVALVAAILIVPLPVSGMIFPVNTPQWSLLMELLANALHAAILHRLSSTCLLMAAAMCALGMAWGVADAGTGDLGANGNDFQVALMRTGFSYIMGMIMARSFSRTRPAGLLDWRLALALPLGVVIALAFLPLSVWVGDVLTIVFVFPLLFRIVAITVPPRRMEATLGWLGSLSFPLYAIHVPVLLIWTGLGGTNRIDAIPAIVLLAIVVAWASPRLAANPRPAATPLANA